MSRRNRILDKFLHASDSILQQVKENPRQFITSNVKKKKTSKEKSSVTKDSSPILNNTIQRQETLKKQLIEIFMQLKDDEGEDDDLNRFGLQQEQQCLRKMVKKLNLTYLVLNLYPRNEGYSIAMSRGIDTGTVGNEKSSPDLIETMKLPYEESDLLEFIDNEELPPMLVDIFHDNQRLFFYGTILMEIRDYRKNSINNIPYYESTFVCLKPTTQTLIQDVRRIVASSGRKWSQDEKITLESRLVAETAEPLCLDPSPMVAVVSNKMENDRKWIRNFDNFTRLMKKKSQVSVNKAKKYESLPAPKGLELFDFLKNKKDRPAASTRAAKKINFSFSEATPEPMDLNLVDVNKFAKRLDPISFKSDNSLVKVEEYVLEFSDADGKVSTTSLHIFHRMVDDCYFGHVEKHRDNRWKINNSSLFILGPKSAVKKYIDQFTEILSDKGKSVKITHKIPGQMPKVAFSSSAEKDSTSSGVANSTVTQENGQNHIPKRPKILQTGALRNGGSALQKSLNLSENSTQEFIPISENFMQVIPSHVDSLSDVSGQSQMPSNVTISPQPKQAGLMPIPPHSPLTSATTYQISANGLKSYPQALNIGNLQTSPSTSVQNIRLHNLALSNLQRSPSTAVAAVNTQSTMIANSQSNFIITNNSMIMSDQRLSEPIDGEITPTNSILSVPIGVSGAIGMHGLTAQLMPLKATTQSPGKPMSFVSPQTLQMTGQAMTTGNVPAAMLRQLAAVTPVSNAGNMINAQRAGQGMMVSQEPMLINVSGIGGVTTGGTLVGIDGGFGNIEKKAVKRKKT